MLVNCESCLTKYIKHTPYIPDSLPPASIMIPGIVETLNGYLVFRAGME